MRLSIRAKKATSICIRRRRKIGARTVKIENTV